MKTLTWLIVVTKPDLDSTPLNSQLRVFSTMRYGVKDIRDLNSGSLKVLSQFKEDK